MVPACLIPDPPREMPKIPADELCPHCYMLLEVIQSRDLEIMRLKAAIEGLQQL